MLSIGQHVSVKGETGIIRFIGQTEFAGGEWVGIELDLATGRNDGSVQGVVYFECHKRGNYGIFVRPSLINLDSSPKPSTTEAVVNRLQMKLQLARKEIDHYKGEIAKLSTNVETGQKHVDALESSLEGLSVDSEYMKSQNLSLCENLELLQAKYDELKTDYAILNEELELNRELEEAVKLQAPSAVSAEDFQLIVQHSKKLELAVSSLKKLAEDNDSNFSKEIDHLKSKSSEFETLRASYKEISKKLAAAEETIALLQEQLESANELEKVIEYLTRENELLQAKVKELTGTVDELTELHELDKSLEENQVKVEERLKEDILNLLQAIDKDKVLISELEGKNNALRKKLAGISTKEDSIARELQEPNNEVELLSLELKQMASKYAEKNSDLELTQGKLRVREKLTKMVIPKAVEYQLGLLLRIEDSKVEADVIISSVSSTWSSTSFKLTLHFQVLKSSLEYLKDLLEWNFDDPVFQKRLQHFSEKLTALFFEIHRSFERVKEGEADSVELTFAATGIKDVVDFCNSGCGKRHTFASYKHMVFKAFIGCQFSELIAQLLLEESGGFGLLRDLATVSGATKERAFELLKDLELATSKDVVGAAECLLPDDIFKFNAQLLKVFTEVELEGSAVSNDDDSEATKIIESAVENELDIPNQLELTNSLLTILNSEIMFADMRTTNIFAAGTDIESKESTKDLKEEDSKFFSQLVEKDRKIQDLMLNIQLLEKNMRASNVKSMEDVREFQSQLESLKKENSDLKERYELILRANQELETRVQSLLENNAVSNFHQQISALEDLKSKRKLTAEMALLEEISLLRSMVTSGFRSPLEEDDLSWLSQPLLSKTGLEERFLSFMDKARQSRASALRMLRIVLSPDSHQRHGIIYNRPDGNIMVRGP